MNEKAGKIKKLVAFLAIAIASQNASACCYGVSKYDALSGGNKTCRSYYRNSDSVANGEVVFSDFLTTHRCRRDSCSARWVQETGALCAGYDTNWASNATNRGRFDPKADAAGKCWKWTCKSGFYMMAGGQCGTLAEKCGNATYYSGVDANGDCIPKWCSGWTGYNSSQHHFYNNTAGGCVEFRCDSGSGFTTRPACQKCDAVYGKVGGCYITPEASGGNYTKCNDNQYTDYAAGGAWGECKALASIGDDRIKACWKCPDIGAMQECYNGGSTCEKTPAATVPAS
ncbi:MAG: hypothetical protein LBL46_02675 [Rickettsiales bacterium]|nr:hypothetical protein [Rickettsiales bacterium]